VLEEDPIRHFCEDMRICYDHTVGKCHYHRLDALALKVPAATAPSRGEFFRVG